MPIRPSAATRPAFFAAFDKPFLRSQSTAASRLPPLSASAALQSIMPAPVWSRSSFTMPALIVVVIAVGPCRVTQRPCIAASRTACSVVYEFRAHACGAPGNDGLLGLGRELLRSCDPAFDAAG